MHPSHPIDYHPDMAIIALRQQQHQHQPHQMQTTCANRSTIVASSGHHLPSTNVAEFIVEDFSSPLHSPFHLPPPLPPPVSSNWPAAAAAEHEMAPPGSTSGPSSMFEDGCVSMTFSPGPVGGGGGVTPSLHQSSSHLPPISFRLPSSQSILCGGDQGFVRGDGSFRCTSGSGADSEDDGERLGGSPTAAAALGLFAAATEGFDSHLLSELGQAGRQYQWLQPSSTTGCDLSPLDPNQSPSLLCCQYPPPFQYRNQFDLQGPQRPSKATAGLQWSFPPQQQQSSYHLSPSFEDLHHQTQLQPSRTIAGIVGLGSSAAATAVYFGPNY